MSRRAPAAIDLPVISSENGNLIDLTLRLQEGMPGHPLHPIAPLMLSGTLNHQATGRWMGENPEFGRVSYVNEQIVISGHLGTHIDAPLHALATGPDATGIDVRECVGAATRLDLRSVCREKKLIGSVDLAAALAPRDRTKSILLLDTGWSDQLESDPTAYFSSSVGLDAEAAAWVRAMGVRCIGIDAPSIDRSGSAQSPAHMEFLRREPPIYVIENLRNLSQLPDEIPLFMGAPLPFAGSSGSPIRALALIDGRSPHA